MKTYNIEPQKIKIANFEIDIALDAIALGEKGRGRTQVIVPSPVSELLESGLSKTGKPRLNASKSNLGWLFRISTEGTYVRGAKGNISVSPEIAPHIKLIAKGQGAFGDAGRIGTWDDVLAETQLEDFLVRVKPSRNDAYLLWFQTTGVKKLQYPEAEALDLDLGDTESKIRGSWIRL
jgi:hypothetical protein